MYLPAGGVSELPCLGKLLRVTLSALFGFNKHRREQKLGTNFRSAWQIGASRITPRACSLALLLAAAPIV